jgi:hypothetical protein
LDKQHDLKFPARAAGAKIVPPELFDQFLVTPDDAMAAFDVGFRWETLPALASALEKRGLLVLAWCLPYEPPL